MRLLFCSDPLSPRAPDSAYQDEAAAADAAGMAYDLINFERLVRDEQPQAAVRAVRPAEQPELAIYRGWMLRPAAYAQLYDALRAKNIELINTPAAYRHCHHLPEWYPALADATPRSVWLPHDNAFSFERVFALLASFGSQPLVVKDYVKSRKHEWRDACFIPAAHDHAAVQRITTRMLELQGNDLNEGMVFRAYEPFQSIGSHAKSGMPLTLEFRCFVLDGALLASAAYWDDTLYPAITPALESFMPLLAQVPSRFFSVDVAQRSDGQWRIVELGDGQVAGLPEALPVASFYQRIAQRLHA